MCCFLLADGDIFPDLFALEEQLKYQESGFYNRSTTIF